MENRRVVTRLLRTVHSAPQLGHLGGVERAPPVRLEPFERQPGVGRAVQPRYGVADRGEHPLHLMLSPLVEDELDAPWAETACAGWSRPTVLEADSLAPPPPP